MPFGSTMQSVLIAGGVSGALAFVSGAAVNAGLFHKFQKATPQTWRPESPARYAAVIPIRLLAGLGFALLFAFTGMPRMPDLAPGGVPPWEVGAKFGALCWMAVSAPMALAIGNFVNVHRGFVVGQLLDWLITSAGAGIACAYLVKAGG